MHIQTPKMNGKLPKSTTPNYSWLRPRHNYLKIFSLNKSAYAFLLKPHEYNTIQLSIYTAL